MSAKKKDIEIKKSKAITIAINFAEGANESFENVDKDSIAIPFLKLLQTNSPECDESAAEYVDGAKAGYFINTVTKEILGNKISLVPCYYTRVYNKWAPRETGGGFKGSINVNSDEIAHAKADERGRLVLQDSTYLTDTRNHFVLVLGKEDPIPMLLALTSTQIKKSKNWLTQMKMLKIKDAEGNSFTPTMYSHSYLIEVVSEENDKGKWKGIKITKEAMLEDANLYHAAKSFADSVKDNKVQVSEPVKEEF